MWDWFKSKQKKEEEIEEMLAEFITESDTDEEVDYTLKTSEGIIDLQCVIGISEYKEDLNGDRIYYLWLVNGHNISIAESKIERQRLIKRWKEII